MQVNPSFLTILAISLIPILLWGIYFYLKNPRKQSLSEIFKIFSLGILSVFPVFIFHKWLWGGAFKMINQIWPALKHPLIFGLLELFLMVLFILFFIAIFAITHSLQLRIFYRLPWYQSFSTIYKRLYSLTPVIFFFGIFVLIELFYSFTHTEIFVLSVLGTTLIFSILEEYFKYIINPFLVYKKINSVGTAMVHALYVGLAFAFVENLLFYSQLENSNFFHVFAYRSLFTTLMHVGTSGIIGYFYGLSLFGNAILANQEIEKSKYGVPSWLKNLLQKTTVYKSILITQGFFLASLLHAIFNWLIYLDQTLWAAIAAIGMAVVILFLLNSKVAQIQYGLIGTPTMPEEDFERLRLQISVLQHVREIQKERIGNS